MRATRRSLRFRLWKTLSPFVAIVVILGATTTWSLAELQAVTAAGASGEIDGTFSGRWIPVAGGLAVLGVLALAFAVADRLSRRLLRPIEDFVETVDEVSAGHLKVGPRLWASPEFRRLADAFDRMLERLREQRQRQDFNLVKVRRRMESLMEYLPSPIFFLDADLNPVLSNRAAVKTFGAVLPREAMPAQILEVLEQVLSTGEAYVPEQIAQGVSWWHEGRELVLLPRVFRVSPDDPSEGLVVVLMDISRLRLSSELQHDLLRVVRHELKTPLTSARLSLHMLQHDDFGALSETQRELVQTARVEVERQLRTIEGLLELGGAPVGEVSVSPREIEVEEVLERAVRDVAPEAEALGLDLRVPRERTKLKCFGDPDRLRSGLGMLLGFVLKHVSTPTLITVGAQRRNGHCRLAATLPERDVEGADDAAEKLFRAVVEAGNGRGLNGEPELALAAAVAHAHGGKLVASLSHGRVVVGMQVVAENNTAGSAPSKST